MLNKSKTNVKKKFVDISKYRQNGFERKYLISKKMDFVRKTFDFRGEI